VSLNHCCHGVSNILTNEMLSRTIKEIPAYRSFLQYARRRLSTATGASNASLRRSYLYGLSVFASSCIMLTLKLKYCFIPVPTSSDRMLEKSLTTGSDVIIYDLEDSVPPCVKDKETARQRLKDFLGVCMKF
jgi:hypothetical protein